MRKHLLRKKLNVGKIYGKFRPGLFLFDNNSGDIVYLYAINDVAFKEISNILKNNNKTKNLSDMNRATILHKIFGLTCDVASDNTEFKITGKPVCPKCNSNKMYSWEPIYPIEIVEVDIPDVSHKHWNKLSDPEKKFRINEAVEKFLADKDNKKIF